MIKVDMFYIYIDLVYVFMLDINVSSQEVHLGFFNDCIFTLATIREKKLG